VALADVQAEDGERPRAESEAVGGQAFSVACDGSDAATVEQSIAARVERFGRLDSVVANRASLACGRLSRNCGSMNGSPLSSLLCCLTVSLSCDNAAGRPIRSIRGTVLGVARCDPGVA